MPAPQQQPPEKRFFRILDGITLAILALELWSIISGLIQCFRWERFDWYVLSSRWMMMLLLGFGSLGLGIALWCLLIGYNIYSLYHKAKLCLRHARVYRRTNALLIQILFLICTAVSLIALLDHSRF